MTDINRIINELLTKRGITDEKVMAEFLSDKPQLTYDPFLLSDMEAGVDLILDRVDEGAKICIYGDYDADGITATCLMLQFLSNITDNLSYYIPSRVDEGYGLNKDAIRAIKEGGAELIITVDCGSVSFEEVEYAKEIGIDIVVTDHHSITDRRADCLLINPKRPDDTYPCKHLAGVGVAFKVAQAIQLSLGLPKVTINSLLDLVALGTVGDIVPLLDENRTMVKYGLSIINRGTRPGLAALISAISLTMGQVTSDNIAFAIVPHLNASGRMGDADVAVKLLTADLDDDVEGFINTLKSYNQKRKNLQNDAFDLCKERVDGDIETSSRSAIILRDVEIYEGIAGIVAGKLKDKYEKPAIIMTDSGEDGEIMKGTGRSVKGINLYEILNSMNELFTKFGGHAGACGFSIPKSNIEEFIERFDSEVEKYMTLNSDEIETKAAPDLDIEVSEITYELSEALRKLEPFGNMNPKPLFAVRNAHAGMASTMGADARHMRFTVSDGTSRPANCVMFNKNDEYGPAVYSGNSLSVIGNIEHQIYNGSKRVQFIVSRVEEEI